MTFRLYGSIVAVMFGMIFIPSVIYAQEVPDLSEVILDTIEKDPLNAACKVASDSAYCNQIREDANSGADCAADAGSFGGDNPVADCGSLGNPFVRILKIAINIITMIAAALSVIFIIIGAIRYSASGGKGGGGDKPGNVASAKKTILYALIGLALTLSAGWVVSLILSTLPG